MAFLSAMNAPSLTKSGVNGSDVYTAVGVGDPRVALYTSLVRDCNVGFIHTQLKAIRGMNAEQADHSAKQVESLTCQADGSVPIRDAFVMAYQARDVRGGKGERDAAYKMLVELAEGQSAENVTAMVRLVPEYGSWRDLFALMEMPSVSGNFPFTAAVQKVISEQLVGDEVAMADDKSVSLLAKWMPREGKKDAKHVDLFAGVLSTDTERTKNWKRMVYRKRVTTLNKYLKTVEIAMCGDHATKGGRWATIKPGAVPGRCLKKNRAAFFNEELIRDKRGKAAKATGLERSEYEDRRACAQHFKDHIKSGKAVKGATTVFPHEIVKDIRGVSKNQQELLEAQWEAIRDAAVSKGGFRRTVPLADFSASMGGLPMFVSMALGILVSEVNHEAFRDHVLTFSDTPSWVFLGGFADLAEKVRRCQESPWGGSTNIEAAFDLILRRMEEHKVPVGEEPEDLVIFTDMGWDAAFCRGGAAKWQTHIDILQEKFRAASERTWGAGQPGWKMPRIVVWNLRAEFKDYHATASAHGVIQLSGWSASTLKVLQEGAISTPTPYQSLRAVLDDPRYDRVRAAFSPASRA
jgi:hypothetical protein